MPPISSLKNKLIVKCDGISHISSFPIFHTEEIFADVLLRLDLQLKLCYEAQNEPCFTAMRVNVTEEAAWSASLQQTYSHRDSRKARENRHPLQNQVI